MWLAVGICSGSLNSEGRLISIGLGKVAEIEFKRLAGGVLDGDDGIKGYVNT